MLNVLAHAAAIHDWMYYCHACLLAKLCRQLVVELEVLHELMTLCSSSSRRSMPMTGRPRARTK